MKVILTGGGTAGHITPNIAILPELLNKGCQVFYIGSYNGIECELISKFNIPFFSIPAGKLRRYHSSQNYGDFFKMIGGFFKSIYFMIRIRPDVVFSKGGFVSCPVVWAAWICGRKVVLHESDVTPGLANKLSIPFAKKICYAFPETAKHVSKKKGVFTGMPIRRKMLEGDAVKGRQFCGFKNDQKPVLLITGGSQGAEAINVAVRENLNNLLETFSICHICGKNKVDMSLLYKKDYAQFEYLDYELQDILAAADVVISRAGATTIFELLALKKPNLLIPLSKNSSRGDQILNAETFRKAGFSVVLDEERLNGTTMKDALDELMRDYKKIVEKMSEYSGINGVDEVMKVLGGFCGF